MLMLICKFCFLIVSVWLVDTSLVLFEFNPMETVRWRERKNEKTSVMDQFMLCIKVICCDLHLCYRNIVGQ